MAVIALINFSSALNIKYVLFVVLALGGAFATDRLWKNHDYRTAFLLLAIGGAALIYLAFPNIFVDDTGFVVRYMNQARQGCFYCFNVSDGPVFGTSSFIYGVTVIGLAMTGIASNSAIIIGVNFVGLSLLFWLLLLILHELFNDRFLAISAAALIVMSSTRLLFSATAGLETNFHLAIVFAGIYFFFNDKRNWMWLFFGLSVISKLDTVPLVTTLSLIHLFENRTDYFGTHWLRSWRSALIFAGLPMLLFVGITFLLFDGPLPQSAYAKLYYHAHPSTHWFPFLELFLERPNRRMLFFLSLILPAVHALISIRNGKFQLREFSLLLGFAATMGLFYIYNPVERMTWYYAMPELLLYSQLLVSAVFLSWAFAKSEPIAKGSYAFLVAAICIISVPMTTGEKQWMDKYLNTVEVERLEIGKMIAEWPAGDTLVSAHGHFGANYKGYVLDMSGLNSKLATDFKLNTDSVLATFHPRYFIQHGSAANRAIAEKNGYVLEQEWTAIEAYDYDRWVLYERE